MRGLAAVALLILASCATSPPVAGLAPYCSSQGAFGVLFGPDPEFTGEVTSWVSLRDPAFAPFTQVEIVHMPQSGIIHSIDGRATFHDASSISAAMVEAERTYRELRSAIEASGAFTIRDVHEDQARYASIGRAEDEVRLWVSHSAGQVTTLCTKVSYRRQLYEELSPEHQRMIDDRRRRGERDGG